MCGFVGFLNSRKGPDERNQQLRDARDVISHRGPDSAGAFFDERLALGHVRLSIIDLSDNAAQPMTSGDGRYVLAYNGEVYNFRDMAKSLTARGVKLRSTGDTEVILEYVSTFGLLSCLQAMEGMFAFALWDRHLQQLVLARDKFGIKPCYYATTPSGEIAFASEMKALLSYSGGPDFSSVNAAMLGLGCAYDSNTLLKGIKSVRNGEYVTFTAHDPAPKAALYFRLAHFVDSSAYHANEVLGPEQVVDQVQEAIYDSVRLTMISDAPLAVLASGGVDSSLISAMAKKEHPHLRLFHADVVGASETQAASALAKYLQCELLSATISPEDTLQYTPIVTYHYEMPLMYHSNAVPFYMVSRLVREHGVKVVLTGEGSDELFIGYPDMVLWPMVLRYRAMVGKVRQIANVIPGLGRLFFPIVEESLANQLRSTMLRYELEKRRGEAQELFAFISSGSEHVRSVMSLDMCEGNVPPLLHRNDRLGMAWGIESRFPFLSSAVSRLALNLPPRFRVRKTGRFNSWKHPFMVDKWCIRKVSERYLPRHLAFRRKFAFRAVAYQKLRVAVRFFEGGFVQEFYGLSGERLQLMLDKATSDWIARMFLLDIWGRRFCLNEPLHKARDLIEQYVCYR